VGRHRNPGLTDAAWLRRRYVDDGAWLAEIAADVGGSRTAVGRALAAAGIAARRRGPRAKLDPSTVTDAVPLVERHGLTGAARHLGVPARTLDTTAVRLGLGEEFAAASRRHQQGRHHAVWPPVLLDRGEHAREYAAKSIRQIAREQGASGTTVARALRLHGPSRRPPGLTRKITRQASGAHSPSRPEAHDAPC
jgi:hypothetical protein